MNKSEKGYFKEPTGSRESFFGFGEVFLRSHATSPYAILQNK